MSKLTPSQEKAIKEIREVFPGSDGEIEFNEDGTVDFRIRGQVARVGKRGKFELRAEPVEELQPSVPVVEEAALPSVEDSSTRTSEQGVSGVTVASGSECGPGEHRVPGPKTSGEGEGAVDGLLPPSPVDVSGEDAGTSNGPGAGQCSAGVGSSSPVEGSEEDAAVSKDPGSRERASTSDTQSGGADPAGSVSPDSSGSRPHSSPATQEAVTDEVTAGQASSDPGSPSGSGEPVPTFDQLPQAHRQEAFEALSLADERQVTAELEGRALSSMVYGFKVSGQSVYGLSWVGAREVVRAFNARTSSEIRISDQTPPVFEDVQAMTVVGWDEEANKPIKEERPAIRCTVYGMDAATGSGQWGTATVPRDQINKAPKMKDGNYYGTTPDGFAANKALSKAQRNALEPMVPRQFVEELIALYKGQDKVEYIQGTGRDVTPELPPALTDERAEGLKDECRELYARFKKLVGPKSRTPAWFQQQLTASQHSHEALNDFREALVQLVGEAEEFVKGRDE